MATIVDNQNIIDNMGLREGDEVDFLFRTNLGDSRAEKMSLLKKEDPVHSQNLRTQTYNLHFIGKEYYADKQTLVQQSFKDIPGSAAIQKIFGQYIGGAVRLLESSIGPISKESGYIVSAQNPFKAINDIKRRLTYGGTKSGSTYFFKDKDGHVLGPLEKMFSDLQSQQTFIQKNTWGQHWTDHFTAMNAIISARAEIASATGMTDAPAAMVQEKTVFDFQTKSKIVEKMAAKIGAGVLAGLPNLGLDFGKGRHGGKPNYMTMDGSSSPASTHPSAKAERESLYQALVMNGPLLTIKVPIQTGILCTVGKGITAKFIPPMGDQNTASKYSAGGEMLVLDLVHELHLDDRMMNGTTSMKCAKGGEAK